MDHDNQKPDGSTPMPFATITPDGLLVGAIPDHVDYEDFCQSLTGGRYAQPGDIASIAICPKAVDNKRAGPLLTLQFPGPDGKSVERVEVGRMTYVALIHCMVAIVRGMQELDLLKYEPGGEMLGSMLDTGFKRRENSQ